MSNNKGASRQNVRVICRVRPTNAKELANGGTDCVAITNNSLSVFDGAQHTGFTFDAIFDQKSQQADVFKDTAYPLISDVLDGYNATIFAYGQTSSGKTHTMEGPSIFDTINKGIIPRSIEALFEAVVEADASIEFSIKVSYFEIYMERIRDLLDVHRIKNNLEVRENKKDGIHVAGLTEEYAGSQEELIQIMARGAENRAVAATGMNAGSSRSHSVITITILQHNTSSAAKKAGKLVLVDLAGSELVKKTNVTGQQMDEAKTINKSLSALGQVIYALTDDKATHIPYRDSKLTRVLQDSLGGNSKTALIVACSPSSYNAPETLSTLRFGSRAKNIQNKVTVNATRSVEELEALLGKAEGAIDAMSLRILSLTTQIKDANVVLAANGLPTISLDSKKTPSKKGTEQAVPAEQTAAPAAESAPQPAEEHTLLISELQSSIQALRQELEDEHNDSLRKDSELTSLNDIVKQNEELVRISEAKHAAIVQQLASQRELLDASAIEKTTALTKCAAAKDELDQFVSRAEFDKRELESTVDTLRIENTRMSEEIAEMSGDVAVGVSSNRRPPDVTVTGDTAMNSSVGTEGKGPASHLFSLGEQSNIGDELDDMTLPVLSKESGPGKVQDENIQSYRRQLSQGREEMQTLFNESDSSAFKSTMTSLWGMSTQLEDKLVEGIETKFLEYDRVLRKCAKQKDYQARQRQLLVADLQTKTAKTIELQMELDLTGQLAQERSNTSELDHTIMERNKVRMSSLQQRLEQLVAVHRQLLRKYGTLELENNDSLKKLYLRDDRMKQLEQSSRVIAGTMRTQAEKHTQEISMFSDMVQALKLEYKQSLELKQQTEVVHGAATGGPKTLRGGAGRAGGEAGGSLSGSPSNHQSSNQSSKTVRGGGSVRTSLSTTEDGPPSPGGFDRARPSNEQNQVATPPNNFDVRLHKINSITKSPITVNVSPQQSPQVSGSSGGTTMDHNHPVGIGLDYTSDRLSAAEVGANAGAEIPFKGRSKRGTSGGVSSSDGNGSTSGERQSMGRRDSFWTRLTGK